MIFQFTIFYNFGRAGLKDMLWDLKNINFHNIMLFKKLPIKIQMIYKKNIQDK